MMIDERRWLVTWGLESAQTLTYTQPTVRPAQRPRGLIHHGVPQQRPPPHLPLHSFDPSPARLIAPARTEWVGPHISLLIAPNAALAPMLTTSRSYPTQTPLSSRA